MNAEQLFYHLRERIGAPSKKDLSDRQLQGFMSDALDWMADQLKYRVVTDKTSGAIVSGVQETLLPDDLAWMVWVEWNGNRLTPAATAKWDRDGTDWRNASAGQPREYAIVGRNIVLLPPPDSATVTTQPHLTFRYIAAAAPLTAGGVLEISELDQWIAVYKAAVLYLKAHPSDTSQALIDGFMEELTERVPRAKRRLGNPIRDYRSHLHVYSERRGGAR